MSEQGNEEKRRSKGSQTNVLEEPQGKEYIREPRRSRRLASKTIQVEECRFEERKGNEYIREPNRSRSGTNPVPPKEYEVLYRRKTTKI